MAEVELPVGSARFGRLEKMPLLPGNAMNVPHTFTNGFIRFTLDESPVYVFVEE